jgi:hypothetical protein
VLFQKKRKKENILEDIVADIGYLEEDIAEDIAVDIGYLEVDTAVDMTFNRNRERWKFLV